jgi:hypothetical protein
LSDTETIWDRSEDLTCIKFKLPFT